MVQRPFHDFWGKMKKYFVFRRLVLSFAAFSLAALLLICLAVFIIYEGWAKREMEHMASVQLTRCSAVVEQNVSSLIPVINNVLSLPYTEIFFTGEEIDRVNEQNLLMHLRNIQSSYDQIVNISLVNMNTRRFFGTQGVLSDYVPEPLREPESALGEMFGMACYRRQTPRNLNIVPSQPEDVVTFLFSPKGRYSQTAILIDMQESYLRQLIRPGSDEQDPEILLVNEEGRVVVGREDSRTADKIPDIDHAEFGSYKTYENGEKSFVAYLSAHIPGYYIVFAVPNRLVSPLPASVKWGIVLLTMLFLLIIVFFSVVLIHRFYSPLSRLLAQNEIFSEKTGAAERRGVDEFKLLYSAMMENVHKLNMLKSYHEGVSKIVGKSWVWSLLRGSQGYPKGAVRSPEFRQGKLEGKVFCVAAIAVDGYREYCEKYDEAQRQLNDFAMSNILDDLAETCLVECMVRMDDNLYAAVFEAPDDARLLQDVVLALRELQAYMWKFFSLSLSVGVSPLHTEWAETAQMFKRACQALNRRFYSGAASFITEAPDTAQSQPSYPVKEEKRIREAIAFQEMDRAKKAVDAFFGSLQGCEELRVRAYAERLAYVLGETARGMGRTGLDQNKLKEGIAQAEFFQELQELLKNCLESLRAEQPTSEPAAEISPIAAAKSYIDENYANYDLSVEFLASLAGLSSPYFGKQFTKEMGMSCLEYIAMVRVCHAAELLAATDLPVADISARTGIVSTNYFYSLFKRKYGMTPIQYRKKHKGLKED